MHSIRKTLIAASAAISALAMFGGAAMADGGAEQLIQFEDLVQNGSFTADASHWTPADHTLIQSGLGKGSVSNTTNVAMVTTEAVASQCVPFELGASPEFKGKIFIPGGQVRTGSAKYRLTFFKSTSCTTFAGSVDLQTVTQTGVSKTFNYAPDAWMAGQAKSVLIQLVVEKEAGKVKDRYEHFSASFDEVKLLVVKAPEPGEPAGPYACFGECPGGDDVADDDGVVCLGVCDDEAEEAPTVPPVVEIPPTVDPVGPVDEPASHDSGTPSDDTGTVDDEDPTPASGSESPATASGGEAQPKDGSKVDAKTSTDKPAAASNDKPATAPTNEPAGNSTGENLVPDAAPKTPLAPATGTASANESEAGTNSLAMFGIGGGLLVGLSLAIVALVRRRKESAAR